jgi:WXG100 family type VII secretion target
MRQTAQGPGGYVPAAGAGGSGFETELGQMVSATAHVEQHGHNVVSQVNRLMSQLEALGPSTWDGEAARAFVQAKLAWNGAQVRLTKALQEIAVGIDNSQKHYGQADSDSQLGITSAVRGLNY